ncbi:heme exporter protein CcmD [Candidatus Pelagibacter bacterium]|nr:heme exporter protein CcmD [Candidatus Pelagibacter bacterium]
MIEKLILMGDYGFFVWLSFAITFFACVIVYLRTYKTLKKYEKTFAKELKELSDTERKKVLENSKIANQVFASYNKSI